MEIGVRKAKMPDHGFIVEFQLQMALETEDLELERSKVTQGVLAVLNDPSKGSYFVAESDGKVLGSVLTTYEWSDWRNGTVLWIQSVYVIPEARGNGVYRKLYQHIQSMVDETPDLAGIRLYVDQSNLTAQQVYNKLGMINHYDVYEWMK